VIRISVYHQDECLMIRGMAVTLVGTAAFKAVCGAVKVLAGFDSQTFPLFKVNTGSGMLYY
jgi:hypothetical protein